MTINNKDHIQPTTKPSVWVLVLVTWFGSGLSPKAPGTIGSLAALPSAWLILQWVPVAWASAAMLAGSFVVFFLGWWVSSLYVQKTQTQDPGLIVIDEVAGLWLTVALSLFLTGQENYVLSFLFFRVFDILKPWPIRWFDRSIHGGLGIMLDDMVAGALAVLPLYILQSFLSFPLP